LALKAPAWAGFAFRKAIAAGGASSFDAAQASKAPLGAPGLIAGIAESGFSRLVAQSIKNGQRISDARQPQRRDDASRVFLGDADRTQ